MGGCHVTTVKDDAVTRSRSSLTAGQKVSDTRPRSVNKEPPFTPLKLLIAFFFPFQQARSLRQTDTHN